MASSARLTREQRREQLLAAAAELLLERGPDALTMEGLARHAGVSKALPYMHFSDSGDVLRSLYRRELAHLAERVSGARSDVEPPSERVQAAVHAYFDVLVERGAVLGVLMRSGAAAAGDPQESQRFVAGLFREDYKLTQKQASAVAALLLGALDGATRLWISGEARRSEAERLVVAVAAALAGAV